MLKVNSIAPEFEANAFYENRFKKVKLSHYKGKWVVLFFYPADFTFVCPTELGELANHYETLSNLGVEILGVSTDTEFVHKAWHDSSSIVKTVKFPMIADPSCRISRAYETLIEDEGISNRATFLIDPDGRIKTIELHDNSVGRDINELIRKIHAAKFVRENGSEVCPVNWKPGEKTLTPGIDLVGKI